MVGTRQFDEDKVLADALALFWRKGLRATSMLDLAAATGVQRGSLYNAFGGKEDLFLLAFDRYAGRFLATARKCLDAPAADVALARFLDAAIASMTVGLPSRGCLTTKTATDSDLIGEAVRTKVRALLDTLETEIETALSRHAGELVLPPAETARLVVTFTRGLAVMERVYHDPRRLRQTADALVQTLVAAPTKTRRRGRHPPTNEAGLV
jgi:TetR/AcrR family transcriptional regulator, transcriptional repressor for nem operon